MQAGCASVAQVLLPGVRSLLPSCFSHTQAAVRGMSCTVSTDSVVLCRASSGAPLDPHLAAEHCKRSCHKASLLQGSETARPGLANTGESFAQQLKHDLVRSTTGCGRGSGLSCSSSLSSGPRLDGTAGQPHTQCTSCPVPHLQIVGWGIEWWLIWLQQGRYLYLAMPHVCMQLLCWQLIMLRAAGLISTLQIC